MTDFLYWYKVRQYIKNYDGDTATLLIDLGFSVYQQMQVRFYGIDTPELRGDTRDEGLIAKQYVQSRLESAIDIVINSYKDKAGKYGRYLAVVYVDGINLNQELVDIGYATQYMAIPHQDIPERLTDG